jgi:hypothetical protein
MNLGIEYLDPACDLEQGELEEESVESEAMLKIWDEIMMADGDTIVVRKKGNPDTALRAWLMRNWSIVDQFERSNCGDGLVTAKVKLRDSDAWTIVIVIGNREVIPK